MPCLRPLEIKLSRKWEPVANKNHGNCRVLYFKITSSLKNYYYDKQHVDTLQKKTFPSAHYTVLILRNEK